MEHNMNNFEARGCEIFFTEYESKPDMTFTMESPTLDPSSQPFMEEEMPQLFKLDELNTANDQPESDPEQNEQNPHDTDNQEQSKKKRNTQNSIRTILRYLRPHINSYWQIGIHKFFESQKQLYLLAVFRKERQQGRLDEIKEIIREEGKELLRKSIVEKDKDRKLQLYLRFFLTLTEEKLDQSNIEKTIKQLGQSGKFKKHPTKSTLQELLEVEAQFQFKS